MSSATALKLIDNDVIDKFIENINGHNARRAQHSLRVDLRAIEHHPLALRDVLRALELDKDDRQTR